MPATRSTFAKKRQIKEKEGGEGGGVTEGKKGKRGKGLFFFEKKNKFKGIGEM
jgi:hypothetical protein